MLLYTDSIDDVKWPPTLYVRRYFNCIAFSLFDSLSV